MRLLTSLYVRSDTGYHILDFPLYKRVERSFLESNSVAIVMKRGEMYCLKIEIFSAL